MNAQTRPPVSTSADYAQWELDRKLRGESKFQGDRIMSEPRDSRVTWVIIWVAGILSTVLTTVVIWAVSLIVSTDKSVSLLLARPVSVSKEQYDSDMRDTRGEIATIKNDVKDIQLKQAAALRDAIK